MVAIHSVTSISMYVSDYIMYITYLYINISKQAACKVGWFSDGDKADLLMIVEEVGLSSFLANLGY